MIPLCFTFVTESARITRVVNDWAYSLVARRYIRIVEARVRFSLGPRAVGCE